MLKLIFKFLTFINGLIIATYLGVLFTTDGFKNYLPLWPYVLNVVLFLTIIILTVKVFQLENDLKSCDSKSKTNTETKESQRQNELSIVTNDINVSVKSNVKIDNAGILNQVNNLTNK